MNKLIIIFILSACFFVLWKSNALKPQNAELEKLKPGTLFTTQGYEKSGSKVKVLAIDILDGTIVYGLQISPLGGPQFTTTKEGKQINISAVGHLPVSQATLLKWGFTITGWEKIHEEELDGYKQWQDAKGGFF